MVIAEITCRPAVGVVGREDAKQVLMLGQEEEVAGFPKRVLHERSQDIISSRRSGYPERPVSSAAGVIEVAVTQVPDTVEIFRSRLRDAWRHHSNLLKKTIHPLCLARPRYAFFITLLKHWRKKQSDWNAWRNFGLPKMYRPLKEEVRYAKKKFPLVMECNQRF